MLAPPPVTHPSFYVIAVFFRVRCTVLGVFVCFGCAVFSGCSRLCSGPSQRTPQGSLPRTPPPGTLPRRPHDFARLSQALREVVVQGWPQDVTQTFQGFISIPIARECPRDLGNISQALCSSILGIPPKAIAQDWPQEFGQTPHALFNTSLRTPQGNRP